VGSEVPEELRFAFVEDNEPSAERAGAEEASALTKRGDAKDPQPLDMEDAAAELKRRVAQVRDASRRNHERARALALQGKDEGLLQPASENGPGSVGHDVEEQGSEGLLESAVDDALSIAQFYERVRRALLREFTDEVWVIGEIRGMRESRGHHYFELADQGAEVVGKSAAQQLEVACWARDWPMIASDLAEAGIDLEVGRVVRVRGKVSVWEGAGKLRFTMTALDVEALLGGIAAARRKLLAVLGAEGLLDANARLPLSLVPLRIGLVTSPGSEGHRDFVGQLDRSGFAFEVHLEASLVQGAEAPSQLASALERLSERAIDLGVIVRGGGARGDLAAFDSEEVARAIATAPFPIWTGIGHTGDRSVADEVAQRALITPTACGEAVVAIVASYWDDITRRAAEASRVARARLDTSIRTLSGSAEALVQAFRHQHDRRSDELHVARARAARAVEARLLIARGLIGTRRDALVRAGMRVFSAIEKDSARQKQVLGAFDPTRQFERGWTLAHDEDGNLIRSASALRIGERLSTRFVDGEATSLVEGVTCEEQAPFPSVLVRHGVGEDEEDQCAKKVGP
jgi:exodeoxyribonuclease VII large subunit